MECECSKTEINSGIEKEKLYKKLFILGVLLLFCVANLVLQGTLVFAQSSVGPDTLWTKTYGGVDNDYGYAVDQTSDGGYIIAGASAILAVHGDSGHAALIKTDSHGNTTWIRMYEEEEMSKAYSVQQTSDGGYIITGSVGKGAAGDSGNVYLVKTDALGVVEWKKDFGGPNQDEGRSVRQTSDNGYIIAGTKGSNVFLIKTDTSGDTVWTETYGGSEDDGGYSVQQTTDGGYIITGVTGSIVEQLDPGNIYLIKTGEKGAVTWTKSYGGANLDKGYSVQETVDGGYIITGYTESFGYATSMSEIYLVKTDSLGDTLWTKTYGGPDEDCGYSVQQTSDGGYIITGSTTTTDSSGTTSMDVYLIKTDANGNTIWTKNIGGTDGDQGYSVQQTSDGGYIIAGYTESFSAGDYDVYLIKTKPILELISPNGGEMLQGGVAHTVEWHPENPPMSSYRFQLLFSSDGGNTYPDTVAEDIDAETETWEWTVPLINSSTCRIKIELVEGSTRVVISDDESDADFVVDITQPVIDSTTIWADTTFSGPFEILTKVSDNCAGVDSVFLLYRRDEDPDWIAVVTNLTGSPLWYADSIPSVSNPGDTVRYYIRALDRAGISATDPEDAPTDYYSFTVNFTGIAEHAVMPTLLSFGLNSNPVRGLAVFNLAMPADAVVTLRIYDITGRLVDTPIAGRKAAGYYEIPWNTIVSSGVYFYLLESPWKDEKGKLVLIR